MLQDMSLTVALNNIQSVDRGEDEKVSFLKFNLSQNIFIYFLLTTLEAGV